MVSKNTHGDLFSSKAFKTPSLNQSRTVKRQHQTPLRETYTHSHKSLFSTGNLSMSTATSFNKKTTEKNTALPSLPSIDFNKKYFELSVFIKNSIGSSHMRNLQRIILHRNISLPQLDVNNDMNNNICLIRKIKIKKEKPKKSVIELENTFTNDKLPSMENEKIEDNKIFTNSFTNYHMDWKNKQADNTTHSMSLFNSGNQSENVKNNKHPENRKSSFSMKSKPISSTTMEDSQLIDKALLLKENKSSEIDCETNRKLLIGTVFKFIDTDNCDISKIESFKNEQVDLPQHIVENESSFVLSNDNRWPVDDNKEEDDELRIHGENLLVYLMDDNNKEIDNKYDRLLQVKKKQKKRLKNKFAFIKNKLPIKRNDNNKSFFINSKTDDKDYNDNHDEIYNWVKPSIDYKEYFQPENLRADIHQSTDCILPEIFGNKLNKEYLKISNIDLSNFLLDQKPTRFVKRVSLIGRKAVPKIMFNPMNHGLKNIAFYLKLMKLDYDCTVNLNLLSIEANSQIIDSKDRKPYKKLQSKLKIKEKQKAKEAKKLKKNKITFKEGSDLITQDLKVSLLSNPQMFVINDPNHHKSLSNMIYYNNKKKLPVEFPSCYNQEQQNQFNNYIFDELSMYLNQLREMEFMYYLEKYEKYFKINTSDNENNTLLIIATKMNLYKSVEFLLSKGANPNKHNVSLINSYINYDRNISILPCIMLLVIIIMK